jgi:hypothetical protein
VKEGGWVVAKENDLRNNGRGGQVIAEECMARAELTRNIVD